MRSTVFLTFATGILLSACSTTAPSAGPDVARLYAEPPARHWESYDAYVKIAAIDDQPTRPVAYVDLKPGAHRLSVTAHRDAAANGMGWGLGLVGGMIGSAIDKANSANYVTTLSIQAVAGETYIARLHDDGTGYAFWIETYPDGRIVSGTKPPSVGKARDPR